jgi:hypothetical protein
MPDSFFAARSGSDRLPAQKSRLGHDEPKLRLKAANRLAGFDRGRAIIIFRLQKS